MIEIRRTFLGNYYYQIEQVKSESYSSRQQCVKGLRSLSANFERYIYVEEIERLEVKARNGRSVFVVTVAKKVLTDTLSTIRKGLYKGAYIYQGIEYKI